VLVAVWGIWLATVLSEPAGLLGCAMHSAAASVSVDTDGALAAPAEIASTVVTHDGATHRHTLDAPANPPRSNHAGSVESSPHQHGDSHGNSSHDCRCVSECCAMAPDALTTATVALFVAPADTPSRMAVEHVVWVVLMPVPHLRPFAIGPPPVVS
jgi:hypothetical protein